MLVNHFDHATPASVQYLYMPVVVYPVGRHGSIAVEVDCKDARYQWQLKTT